MNVEIRDPRFRTIIGYDVTIERLGRRCRGAGW